MNEKARSDKELTVKIETTVGVWETTFPKTTKVKEVIQSVIQHFGFAANGNYKLFSKSDSGKELEPERPLVSYGVKDGDILRFVDLGVAV